MRNWVPLAVMLLIVGCGNNRHYTNWPASFSVLSSFSETEVSELLEDITGLNQLAAFDVLESQDKNKNGYPITIRKVGDAPDQPNRIGYAIVSSSECIIELNEKLFEAGFAGLRKSVLYHEVGHCLGLQHPEQEDPRDKEIMSRTAAVFESYSQAAIDRFIQTVLDKIESYKQQDT